MSAFPPSEPASRNILIVDDDALVGSCVADILGESGLSVIDVAASALEALALAAEHPIAIALVDIHLSGPIDGIELACRLRQRYGVRTIFLSGDRAAVERAYVAAPPGDLARPFEPSQVFAAIRRAKSIPLSGQQGRPPSLAGKPTSKAEWIVRETPETAITSTAQRLLAEHGPNALRRAVEGLNDSIDRGALCERDRWACIVSAIGRLPGGGGPMAAQTKTIGSTDQFGTLASKTGGRSCLE